MKQHIQPRIPENLHFELKINAVKMQLGMNEIIEQLLRKWMAGEMEPAQVSYNTTLKRVHVEIDDKILRYIKKSGVTRCRLIAGLIEKWLTESEKY
jgi:Trm5-related predicted tRNA methylase